MPDTRLLGIYLNDHLAGATAGVALARRAAANNRGTELGDVLEHVAAEIEEDRRELLRAMARLGIEPGFVKRAAALLAERVGRVKLNGRLRGYSPLSRVVELESLTIGIEGKRSLWVTLREAPGVPAALAGIDLDRLVERAERQQAALASHRSEAARIAFGRDSG